MKGLVLVFLSIAVSLIGWQYLDKATKRRFKALVRNNLGAVIFALIAVVAALFVSMNTTLRLI